MVEKVEVYSPLGTLSLIIGSYLKSLQNEIKMIQFLHCWMPENLKQLKYKTTEYNTFTDLSSNRVCIPQFSTYIVVLV